MKYTCDLIYQLHKRKLAQFILISKEIDFINDTISAITKFKGNTRNANKVFYSKYQILSMTLTTFKKIYGEKTDNHKKLSANRL